MKLLDLSIINKTNLLDIVDSLVYYQDIVQIVKINQPDTLVGIITDITFSNNDYLLWLSSSYETPNISIPLNDIVEIRVFELSRKMRVHG